MQFANIDGKKAPPFPRVRGTCPLLASQVVAECGGTYHAPLGALW